MVAIRVLQITFKKEGCIITVQGRKGAVSLWLEPPIAAFLYRNYIIVGAEVANQLTDIDYFEIPKNFTFEDIIETIDKIEKVRC